MDFTKFVAMLEYAGLFFCRADCLDDAFEGSYPRAHETLRPILFEDIPAALRQTAFKMKGEHLKWFRQWVMINCWHMNEHESAAMWKLYAKSNEAVCVQSTYELLRQILGEGVYIGMVKYIDYDKDWMPEGNIFYPFMHKRKSFEHERELRALIDTSPKKPLAMHDADLTPPEGGVWREAELNNLIERIYIAPSAPKWIPELVRAVTNRYHLDKEVIQSSLDDAPFF